MSREIQDSPQELDLWRAEMRTPDDVTAMMQMKGQGWGAKRIAAELGCSKNTVKRWLALGGWQPYQAPQRPGRLAGLEDWLAERFRLRQHDDNADVIWQELATEHGITVSLRTVERAVAPWRQELRAQRRARCGSRPGRASSCRSTSANGG